jgi:hypothetical protein
LSAFTEGYPTTIRRLYTGVYQRGKLPIRTDGWFIAMTSNRGCVEMQTRRTIYGFRAKAGNAVLRMKT